MQHITLDEIEQRYQEYLKLSALDKALINMIDDNPYCTFEHDKDKHNHCMRLMDQGWIKGNVLQEWNTSDLTDLVNLYASSMAEQDRSNLRKGIHELLRLAEREKERYEKAINDINIRLEIARKRLSELPINEDV